VFTKTGKVAIVVFNQFIVQTSLIDELLLSIGLTKFLKFEIEKFGTVNHEYEGKTLNL
jgi:hypothetical protein